MHVSWSSENTLVTSVVPTVIGSWVPCPGVASGIPLSFIHEATATGSKIKAECMQTLISFCTTMHTALLEEVRGSPAQQPDLKLVLAGFGIRFDASDSWEDVIDLIPTGVCSYYWAYWSSILLGQQCTCIRTTGASECNVHGSALYTTGMALCSNPTQNMGREFAASVTFRQEVARLGHGGMTRQIDEVIIQNWHVLKAAYLEQIHSLKQQLTGASQLE